MSCRSTNSSAETEDGKRLDPILILRLGRLPPLDSFRLDPPPIVKFTSAACDTAGYASKLGICSGPPVLDPVPLYTVVSNTTIESHTVSEILESALALDRARLLAIITMDRRSSGRTQADMRQTRGHGAEQRGLHSDTTDNAMPKL